MKQHARTLHHFNGGESCVRQYIAKLDFFFDEALLRKDSETAQNIANYYKRPNPEDNEDSDNSPLGNFFNSILNSYLKLQLQVREVFPKPQSVLVLLVQRIFEQRIRLFFGANDKK